MVGRKKAKPVEPKSVPPTNETSQPAQHEPVQPEDQPAPEE